MDGPLQLKDRISEEGDDSDIEGHQNHLEKMIEGPIDHRHRDSLVRRAQYDDAKNGLDVPQHDDIAGKREHKEETEEEKVKREI